MTSLICSMWAMCPDGVDKADSGTKRSGAVRTWKSSNNRRACFHSTGFAEQSLFFRLAISKAFREDLRGLYNVCTDRQYTSPL